jgi:hypothetical protein
MHAVVKKYMRRCLPMSYFLMCVRAGGCGVCYFPEGTTYAVSFRDMVPMKSRNLIRITRDIFKTIAVLFLRAFWETSVSGAWMFIFTGHQTVMDKLLDTRIKSVQILRCQQGTHTHILTSREMAFEEPLFHILGGWKCINLLKSIKIFFSSQSQYLHKYVTCMRK